VIMVGLRHVTGKITSFSLSYGMPDTIGHRTPPHQARTILPSTSISHFLHKMRKSRARNETLTSRDESVIIARDDGMGNAHDKEETGNGWQEC